MSKNKQKLIQGKAGYLTCDFCDKPLPKDLHYTVDDLDTIGNHIYHMVCEDCYEPIREQQSPISGLASLLGEHEEIVSNQKDEPKDAQEMTYKRFWQLF